MTAHSWAGAPSWKYLAWWKHWEDTKGLEPEAKHALRKVVTDRYFHEATSQTDEGLLKARTMAWSLTYFLAEKRTDGLLRYFDELGNLPRDMELDEDALMACFGRALDLMDGPSQTQINPAKLTKLAEEWYQFLHYTNLEASEAVNDLAEAIKAKQLREIDVTDLPVLTRESALLRRASAPPLSPATQALAESLRRHARAVGILAAR